MSDYSIQVPEMETHKICYETCIDGEQYEQVYVVTDKEWNMEHEGCIGFILQENDQSCHFGSAVRLVFDGLLYIHAIKEEEVIKIIGKEKLELHKKRMAAIEELKNSQAFLTLKDLFKPEPLTPEQKACDHEMVEVEAAAGESFRVFECSKGCGLTKTSEETW